MQVVFHAGVHFTEEVRLMKCLLRNAGVLHEKGARVPGPTRYRRLLRDTIVAMEDGPLAPDAREIFLDAMVEDDRVERLILSHPHLFAWPRAALRSGFFYPEASIRMARLAQVFEKDDVELFMAVRNPATFIPKSFDKNPKSDIIDFLDGFDPREFKWSDMLWRLRNAVPHVPITVWCNEDAPLLWAQIIREIAGLEHMQPVIGQFDLACELMTKRGADEFMAYLESNAGMTEIHLRRVSAAFLDRYALEEKIQEEVDLPGFTGDLLAELSELYEEDMDAIKRIPGVEVLTL